MSFNAKLTAVLKTDRRFIDDQGELLIPAVRDRAWRVDQDLLTLLLSDKDITAKFFDEITGHWVFNFNTFIEYISQKDFLDNSYTRFRNRIGLTIGDMYLRERGDVALVWPYKDTVLEGGQTKEREKRQEIFFNEVLAEDEINRLLAPKVLTNFVRYTAKGKQRVKDFTRDENGVIRDNFVVKGNNLLALHTLKSLLRGQVKLIYIDPPFNTGSDSFGYNDRFNHSTWLTFMKSRLEIAKTFLRDEGAIFIHHDDKEHSYLRILCDEIFGRSNFLNNIVVKTSDPSGHKVVNPSPFSQTEHILLYAKHKAAYRYEIAYVQSEYDPGYNQFITNRSARPNEWHVIPLFDHVAKHLGYTGTRQANKDLGHPAFLDAVAEFALEHADMIFQPTAISDEAGADIVRLRDSSGSHKDKIYIHEREGYETVYIRNGRQMYFYSSKVRVIDGVKTPGKPLTNLWTDIPYNGISGEGGVKLLNGKKPEKLLRRILDIGTNKGDLVLDFFSGSGTTAAVAHKMSRRYIGIEQLEYGDNDTVVRLQNVMGGDTTGISKVIAWKAGGEFICCELMKYNEAFMERIQAATSSKELVRIWRDMAEGSFLNWYVTPQVPEDAVISFEAIGKEDNGVAKQKRLLAELLDKNQLYVNLSEIDDAQFKVSEDDKTLNKAFYGEAYNG